MSYLHVGRSLVIMECDTFGKKIDKKLPKVKKIYKKSTKAKIS